jgi:serine/threonine protein kinase
MDTSMLSRYEILRSLGAGGMGQVLKARDLRLKRVVALKMLRPGSLGDEEARERFLREARLAAQLNHPNIATIYDIFESDGDTLIAMEYVEGETLRDRVQRGPLPLAQALDISIQIAHALIAAHKQSIIHRDIKPENIKITPEGHVKVLDFGLAKRLHTGDSTIKKKEEGQAESTWMTQEDVTWCGTPGYSAPEQWKGDPVDERADIFSFGAVLYEMITGRAPFARPSSIERITATMHSDPEPITEYVQVPHQLENSVQKALAKEPDQRYQSVTELLAALEQIKHQPESPVAPSGLHAKLATLAARLSERRSLVLACKRALVVIVVGMAFFLISRAVTQENPPVNAPAPTYQKSISAREGNDKKKDGKEETKKSKVNGFLKKVGGGLKKAGSVFKSGDKKTTKKQSNDKKP